MLAAAPCTSRQWPSLARAQGDSSAWPSPSNHAPAGHGAPAAASVAAIDDLTFETSASVEVVGSFDAMGIRSLYGYGFEKPSSIQKRVVLPIITGAGPARHRQDLRDLPLSLARSSASGGLGVFTGLFFGALENPILADDMTARQQIVYQAKQMGRRSMSNAKTFAVMGVIFSAAECVVQKGSLKGNCTRSCSRCDRLAVCVLNSLFSDFR